MRKLMAPVLAAGLLMVFGCTQETRVEDDSASEQLENAGNELENAADQAGDEIEQAGENAADAVDDATDGNPNTNP